MVYESRNLLLEYTKILLGQKTKFSDLYFSKKNPLSCQENALMLFRYAIEIFLRWTPERAEQCLTKEIIELMRLDLAFPYMDLPPEVMACNDYSWILHQIYPQIRYDSDSKTLEVYKAVLNGDKHKWPKKFFDGYLTGNERACICLRYMLEHEVLEADDINKKYELFASPNIMGILKQYRLKKPMMDLYSDPVTFLYMSMPEAQRDPFKYHYYLVKYHYMRELRNEEKIQRGDAKEKRRLARQKQAETAEKSEE